MQRQRKTVSVRILSAFMVMALLLAMVLPAQAAPADAASYAAVFDYIYYAQCYPDLQAVFGTNEAALLNHFITCGMAEGRQGNAEFNVQYYRANYPDLQAVFGDNLPAYYMHY
ncbi:MAG: vancomycin resistance protein, partial [Lachnospiraceae bacterium]|nr:vancomycin resistance protein [Lachnospiraceae bacterium]